MAALVNDQMRAAWAIPQFRRLMYSRVVSNIGNGISPVALAFGVLGLKGANGTSLTIVNGSLMVSLALFMLVGGVAADRFGRCRLVGASDIIGGCVAAVSAVLLITGHASVPFLAVNAFLFGALNAVWLPAFRGITPQLVPADLLQSANSWNGVFANVFMMLGAGFAGLIVTLLGAGWGVMIDAVSFLVAGILVWSLRSTDAPNRGNGPEPSLIGEMREGWNEFSSRRWLVAGLAGTGLYWMVLMGFLNVAGPVQAKLRLGGANAWGMSVFGWGLGGLIGVLIAARVRPRRPLRTSWVLMSMCSLWFFSTAAAMPLLIVMMGAVAAGIANDFMFQFSLTEMQTRVPGELLSRVGSYTEFAPSIAAPIGLALTGPLVDSVGATDVCVAVGVLSLVACAVPLSFRSLRNLERSTP